MEHGAGVDIAETCQMTALHIANTSGITAAFLVGFKTFPYFSFRFKIRAKRGVTP